MIDLLQRWLTSNWTALTWFVMSSVFLFISVYTFLILLKVGGIYGTCLTTVSASLSIMTNCFGWIVYGQTVVHSLWLWAIVASLFWPILLASVVLADIYSATHNSRGSFTARSYWWWRKIVYHEYPPTMRNGNEMT